MSIHMILRIVNLIKHVRRLNIFRIRHFLNWNKSKCNISIIKNNYKCFNTYKIMFLTYHKCSNGFDNY